MTQRTEPLPYKARHAKYAEARALVFSVDYGDKSEVWGDLNGLDVHMLTVPGDPSEYEIALIAAAYRQGHAEALIHTQELHG